MMKFLTYIFLFGLISLFQIKAQTPGWDFVQTDNNHTIAITIETNPNINGVKLENGDFIGAFFQRNDSLICGGYIVWNGVSNVSLTVWGDDSQTQLKEGFAVNEKFNWLLWRRSDKKTFVGVASFSDGPETYIPNGISSIAALTNKKPDWNADTTAYVHNIVIPTNTNFNLGALTVSPGDYFAAFYDSSGVLTPAGFGMWEGTTDLNIKLFGDDPLTSQKDGFSVNENITWRYWNAEKDSIVNVNAIYESGPTVFTISGNSKINEIVALAEKNPGWTFKKTDINHIIAIPIESQPKIDDTPLREGDYIGVFYKDGTELKCAGYSIWNGKSSIAVTAWGDDAQTNEKDGYETGETFKWKIWSSQTEQVVDAIATYDFNQPNDSSFASNGLSALTSLIGLGKKDTTDVIDTTNAVTLDVFIRFLNTDQTSGYRIIGLPGVDGPYVDQLMNGVHGKDWIGFSEIGKDHYLPYSFGDREEFRFGEGKAFWLLGKKPFRIDSLRVKRAKPVNGSFPVKLHKGWNLITSPFTFPVAWEDVKTKNNITDNIYQFVRGSFKSGSYTFDPYIGYYFYNRKDLLNLEIPYTKKSSFKKNNEDIEPNITLQITKDTLTFSNVEFVIDNSSLSGLDDIDQFSPPGYFEEKKLFIFNQNLESGYKYLQRDARPLQNDGAVFTLFVKAPKGDTLSISRDKIDTLKNYSYFLLNMNNFKLYDLTENNSVIHVQKNDYDEYKLIIGTKEFIEDNPVPEIPKKSSLYQNYPNPFNPSTNIKYFLKSTSYVRIVVYNMLGQEISRLVNGVRESGLHEVTWNADFLASGIYFYTIEARGISDGKLYRESKKMILLR